MSEYINYHYNAECQVCFETGLLVYDGLCADCIYDFLVQQPLTNHFHSKVFKTFDLLYYTSIDDKITNLVIEQLKNKIKQDVELNFKGYIDRKVKEFKDNFGVNVATKFNKTKLDYLMKIINAEFDKLTNEDYDEISRYLNSYKRNRITFVQYDQLIDCIIEELNFVLIACPMDELHTIYDVLIKNVNRFVNKKCIYEMTNSIIVYLIYDTSRNYLLKTDRQLSRENVKSLFRDLCNYVPVNIETLINTNSKIVGLCNDCQGKVNSDYVCIQCGTKHCNKCFKNANDSKHKCNQQDKDDYKYLVKTTVMCPTCGLRVTKNGGCKHMFCLRCRTSYDVDPMFNRVTKTKDTHTNPDEHSYYVRNDLLLSYQYVKHFSSSLFEDNEFDDDDNSDVYEEIIQRVTETIGLGPHIIKIPDINVGLRDDLETLFGESHIEVFICFNELRTYLVIEDETEIQRSYRDFVEAFNHAVDLKFNRARSSEDKSKKRMTKISKILDKLCKQKRIIGNSSKHYSHVNPTKKPTELVSKLIIEQVDKSLLIDVDDLNKKLPSEYKIESKDIINYELEDHIKHYIKYKKTTICYNLTSYVNKLFKSEMMNKKRINDEIYKTYFTDYLCLVIKRFNQKKINVFN